MIDFGSQRTAAFLDKLRIEVKCTLPQKQNMSHLNLIQSPDRIAFTPANESNSYIILIEYHQDSLYCGFTEVRDEFYSACLTENKLHTQLKATKGIQTDKSKHYCPISPGTEADGSARLVLTCLYLNINLHSNLLLKAVCIFCMCGGEVGRMCLPLQACFTLCAKGGSAARLQFLMKVKGL